MKAAMPHGLVPTGLETGYKPDNLGVINVTKLNITKLALLGATALLGAASAHAQVADSWTVGAVSVGGFNSSTDGTTLQSSGGDTASTTSASIAGGERNSISAAAVGASGSTSFTVNNLSGGDSAATLVTDTAAVTAGNSSAVLNNGDIVTPNIAGGDSNSVSRAAVGSSASISATTNSFNGSSETTSVTMGDLTIASGDGTDTVTGGDATGAGGNAGTVNLTATTIDTPDIAGGNQNSVSASAVGSSASFSVANNAYDAGIDNTFTVGGVTVTASNSSDGAVTADAGGDVIALASPKIEAGDQNSVSVNAIGSSGSVSYASNYYGDGTNGASITTTGTIGDIAVTTYNGGAVVNTTDIATPTISADANNSSVGVAGIGTSASTSFASNDFTAGTATSTGAITAGGVTLLASNAGGITVGSSMDTPVISGGLNNSISTSAVGASASLSFSNFTH